MFVLVHNLPGADDKIGGYLFTSGKTASLPTLSCLLLLSFGLALLRALLTRCGVWDHAGCGNFQLLLTYEVTAVAEVLLSLLLPVAWGLWSL